jgi:outer membrane protein assembly factor BamB
MIHKLFSKFRVILVPILCIPLFLTASEHTIINGTFLGGEGRNYYGNEAPSRLELKWSHYLGEGETTLSRKGGNRLWKGCGWTGQPLLVESRDTLFLIQGAYDHHLKKIHAESGELIWQYAFDDVIKSTGTLYRIPGKDRLLILQGSRLGLNKYLNDPVITSYRAIDFITGEDVWKYNVPFYVSYSRDVDGSALIIDSLAYLGLENGQLIVFDPRPDNAIEKDGFLQPLILEKHPLYSPSDSEIHGMNLVTESSPCRLGNRIYITSGSGHVYGYNLKTRRIDWDFFVGSDIDGSPVVTSDNCLLITLEKEFIPGNGGLMKLNPRYPPDNRCVEWFLPTGNARVAEWLGGVIGSASVNDKTRPPGYPGVAAITALDSMLYLIDYKQLSGEKVLGPDSITYFNTPVVLDKVCIGPSISTPVFAGDKIVAAGYWGIYLFQYSQEGKLKRLDARPFGCEATPVIHNKKIYIGSRNGYLYCFGD